ncbi:uncharacterized protein LACBIDRAFT_303026 [Laccaria bicolor S238N-H82]|uniref:Predicted protein n=1 Tax=Laccaria bicolor (strain S238N-H82 / ATCC MYA-4686) TaxID=486041 RepID=B0DIS7_LACBS|nr:uncharacterized protein LACBIDRAFT_303026 [Laccaria bicolor S238N-H82]EDR05395.1 predicted protein [Laccaria bicolor S238N-H82]|eukprot:XP_001883953.1 predicted protein [Laccaria bicolor S238N-H82]
MTSGQVWADTLSFPWYVSAASYVILTRPAIDRNNIRITEIQLGEFGLAEDVEKRRSELSEPESYEW